MKGCCLDKLWWYERNGRVRGRRRRVIPGEWGRDVNEMPTRWDEGRMGFNHIPSLPSFFSISHTL